MQIYLPNSAFLGNIDPFLRGFQAVNPKELVISANKKWISVHPVVLSMVGALGLTVEPQQVRCEKLEAKSKHYLERMGLFKILKIRSDITIVEHEPAGRFIPLTQITYSQALTDFITEMVPLLHLDPSQAEPIRYIMSELVQNVLEHAQSKHGAVVSAQYYVKSNTIRIGIADTGVGIQTTINYFHRAETDLQAIRLALIPGITGTTSREGGTELNAGAGLFFIKSIATMSRDFFMIYSGHALYKLLKSRAKSRIRLAVDPFDDRHSQEEDLPYWQGTAVGIDISLDTTQAFSLLLDHIRESYRKAVRERKKARYKKARFI